MLLQHNHRHHVVLQQQTMGDSTKCATHTDVLSYPWDDVSKPTGYSSYPAAVHSGMHSALVHQHSYYMYAHAAVSICSTGGTTYYTQAVHSSRLHGTAGITHTALLLLLCWPPGCEPLCGCSWCQLSCSLFALLASHCTVPGWIQQHVNLFRPRNVFAHLCYFILQLQTAATGDMMHAKCVGAGVMCAAAGAAARQH